MQLIRQIKDLSKEFKKKWNPPPKFKKGFITWVINDCVEENEEGRLVWTDMNGDSVHPQANRYYINFLKSDFEIIQPDDKEEEIEI